ncbi:HAD family hydrolase [Paenibacillus senegalensis]|uniref:HAD family hydrolase n=1 Tax=Paenibacillus senegalensis TaxID=1465766 RepID=UPI0002891312|nr:HAD hydrolase-like protein [Paenibacillus senegalensis]
MSSNPSFRAIIFDMDNTLIQSTIDFVWMKRAALSFLQDRRLLPEGYSAEHKTTAQVIEDARKTSAGAEEWMPLIWEVLAEVEREGMKDAGPEPGADKILEQLHGRYPLVVLTNNAYQAAITALEHTGMIAYLDHVVGRDQIPKLKPSCSGVRYIHGLYPDIEPAEWLSIGDSWIDGRAAIRAGSRFLAYRGDRSKFAREKVEPIGWIDQLEDIIQYL